MFCDNFLISSTFLIALKKASTSALVVEHFSGKHNNQHKINEEVQGIFII